MKPEDKKLWTDALRSGDFEQGAGFLCKDGKYCCLGVYEEVKGRMYESKPGRKHSMGIKQGHWGDPVSEEAIEEIYSPTLNFVQGLGTSLATMNDSGNFTFSQIADWIDANL